MTLYIAIWFILLLAATQRRNMVSVWVLLGVLVILSGLRNVSVGTDTGSYRTIFDGIVASGGSYIEPGWTLLNKVSIWLGGGFQFMLLFTALVTLVPVGLVGRRVSPNPAFSIFAYYSLFLFFSMWNISRQLAAMSFVLMGYAALDNGRKWRGAVWIVLSMTLHLSAVFSFLALLAGKLRLTARRLWLWLVASFFIGIAMSGSILALVAGPYAAYLADGNARNESPVAMLALTAMYNALLIWLFVSAEERVRHGLWMKLFVIGVIMHNLTVNFELGTRLTLYFSMAQVVLLPQYVCDNRIKQKPLAALIVTLYLSVMFYLLLLMNSRGVVPYRLFF